MPKIEELREAAASLVGTWPNISKITLAAIEDAQKWERICKAGGEDLYDFIRRNDDGTFDFAMLDDLPAAVRAVLEVTGGGE